ncbi:unnamed protein product [Gongylonema pulchrum]|uniref:Chitin-binding type-2 domain-containing protein n=1 Tax=Gongylonema pulchrum TaxID=637853 RepID=A0A183CYY8_9BILA|nr:unnamed protein product [Gongylonema pulchrum]
MFGIISTCAHLTFLRLLFIFGTIGAYKHRKKDGSEGTMVALLDDLREQDEDYEEGDETIQESWDPNERGDEQYYRKNHSEIKELSYGQSQFHCGDNESFYVPETEQCYRVFYCPESLRYRWRTFAWSTCAEARAERQWLASSLHCSDAYRGQLFDFLDSPTIKLRFAWWIAKKIAQKMERAGFFWNMAIGTRMDGDGMLIGTRGSVGSRKKRPIRQPISDLPKFRVYKPLPCQSDVCCLAWYSGKMLKDFWSKTIIVARRSCENHGGGTYLCQKNANSGSPEPREKVGKSTIISDDRNKFRLKLMRPNEHENHENEAVTE